MLAPIRQLYPIRLVAPSDTRTFTIETNLPVAPVLFPKMFFRNTSLTDSAEVSISHVLNLGITDDPLLSGSFSTVLFDSVLAPGQLLWHVFPSSFLADGIVFHTVTLTVTAISSDVIMEAWVEGLFEESLKVLPTYEPIII